eukprot:TRINITY_DN39781_c0_g1_i1.p1 TRINITY_DN39781_c0_g1~~TRINITY_DN39781_c0_g1_i1.p1  ORF type:complete len:596 (-),score=119.71 TRINITY_DN39781_c0_g1_i1:65-1654(-)
MGSADLAEVPTMGSGQLRKLAEAAAAEGASPALWAALAARCEAMAEKLKYWDAVQILQAFTAADVERESLMLCLADTLSAKTSKMAPKHILDVLAVYEATKLRPRALYVELLHAIVRLSGSMYAEETSLTLQALARYGLGNPTVIAQLSRTLVSQLKEYRLRYLCGVTGALGAMRACPAPLLAELDKQAHFEVDTVPLQELLDNLQAFPLMEYSWKPYEDLCLEELLKRMSTFRTAEDVDQLVQPFDALLFLQARGLLHKEFLQALMQWCLRGVHRPNVRSERRPTSRQLVLLHDRCRELGLEDSEALQDAIQYYVESGGGLWQSLYPQPLKYSKRRRYIRSDDPLEGLELPPLPLLEGEQETALMEPARQQVLEDLPGLPSSAPGSDLFGQEDALMPASAPVPAGPRRKPSAPSPELAPEESSVRCWVTTRKGPRPRRPRDIGLKKYMRKDMPRAPLWLQGGWQMRPKYQPGKEPGFGTPQVEAAAAAAGLPATDILIREMRRKSFSWQRRYARVPVGKRGAAWVLRR